MKKFWANFKAFINKGNAASMAIGVIIGGAFTAIVNSLVKDVISPLIGVVTGGIDFSAVSFGVKDAQIMIGNFINAIITFVITALVLFWIVSAITKVSEANERRKAKNAGEPEAPAEPEPAPVPEDIQLLTEIRDLLKEKK